MKYKIEALQEALDELQQERDIVDAKLRPLQARLAELRCQVATLRSELTILRNGIRREDVQFSKGEGIPWFWHVADFIDWARTNSNKPWMEWNDRIYEACAFFAGHMDTDNAPRVYELK